MREPNFFLVGAPKCGTTALYAMIGSHPEVHVSPVKEPDFFATDLLTEAPFRPVSAVTDEAKYLRLFADAGAARAVGEGSVSYLASHTAAAAIARRCPEARVLMVLRDPAARLFSHYTAASAARATHLSFAAWFAERKQEGGVTARFGPIEPGRYASHLRKYLLHFESSRVQLVWHDDFVRDPAKTVSEVFAFLGVDSQWSVDTTLRRNETPTRWWRRRPRMTIDDRALAIREYKHEIVDLAALTGRRLDPWLDSSAG